MVSYYHVPSQDAYWFPRSVIVLFPLRVVQEETFRFILVLLVLKNQFDFIKCGKAAILLVLLALINDAPFHCLRLILPNFHLLKVLLLSLRGLCLLLLFSPFFGFYGLLLDCVGILIDYILLQLKKCNVTLAK